MRTHLLRTVPSSEPDADTGCAAKDKRCASSDPIALITAAAVAATTNTQPAAPTASAEDERYWLDGYAGILCARREFLRRNSMTLDVHTAGRGMWRLAAAIALAFLPAASCAFADSAGDAADAVTGNAAVVSDYMFRGITQTWGHTAIQGGGDLTLKDGFAAGFWGSSVSKNSYPGAALELDLYASYGANFSDDWSWRVGLYGYVYPGGNLDQARPALPSRSFDTLEANAALSWKWLTLKYSTSLTDYFGIDSEQGYRGDSRGTGYLQLDASIPINDAWSVALHAAHTRITTELVVPLPGGQSDPSYTDLGAMLKWQLHPHLSASFGITYADNGGFYHHVASLRDANQTKDCGGTRSFLMLQGTF